MRRLPSLLLVAIAAALIWLLSPAPIQQTGEASSERATAPSSAGVLVVDLQDDATAEQIAAFEQRHGLQLEYSSEVSQDEALLRAQVPDLAAALAQVETDPLVQVAEQSILFEALAHPNDPMWDQQWNMRRIDAPAGWRVGGGRGVKVAVIDTGVSQVEDLEGTRLTRGRTFVPGTKTAADDHGHGTHVAGTIAQTTHNGVGVAGVAPNAQIMPYKVLSRSGSGASDWIAAAIDDAVDEGAQVINLSLGGGHSAVLHKAVEEAVAAGVVVVAAAGNSGARGVGCPAHAEGVIGVAAVGPDDNRAFYSTWGTGVELSGPGGDTRNGDAGGILQDTVDGSGGHAYRAFQGTSMASPHVAGAAALLRGMGLDARSAEDMLQASAEDLGEDGFDEVYGHGLINVQAAVQRVLVRRNGLLFLVGGAMGLGMALFTGMKGGRALTVAGAAALTAGGLFFLPLLPLPPVLAVELLGRDLVSWPAIVSPTLAHFPLWTSALLPAALAFVLGPTRTLGAAVAGVCAGFGASLLYGAAAGTIDPWGMGLGLDKLWLSVNGTLCMLAAMVVIGAQRLRSQRA